MPNTLYDFYKNKKQPLPSLTDRASLYEQQGLGKANEYAGTADQNTNLLGKLQTTPAPVTEPATLNSEPPVPVIPGREMLGANIPPERVPAEMLKLGKVPSSYTGPSVVQFLKDIGQPTDFASRSQRAALLGIPNYTGTAEQNTLMLKILRGDPDIPTGGNGIVTSDTLRNAETRDKTKATQQTAEQLQADQSLITSLQNKKTITELKRSLAVGEAPAIPTLAKDYQTFRSKEGLPAIEYRMQTLDTQIANMQNSLAEGLNNEESRLAPMELLTGRMEELQNQGLAKISALQKTKEIMQNEYTTKLGIIQDIIEFEQADYSNAYSSYQTKFNQAIQVQDTLDGENKDINDENQLVIDNARANLSVLMGYVEQGDTSKLPQSIQNSITKLSMQAGIPGNVINFALQNKTPETTTHLTQKEDNDGNAYTQILTLDKNGGFVGVKNVYEGGLTKPAESTGNPTEQLTKLIGPGGFVDINAYRNLRAEYATKGIKPSTFDSYYSNFLSPSDRAKFGIGSATGYSATGQPTGTNKAADSARLAELMQKSNNGENLDSLSSAEMSEFLVLLQ